jgi:hypothetical protein
MPHSGVAFVRGTGDAHDAPIDHPSRRNVMCIERILRNGSFALASAAILLGLGYTLEVLPVVSSLVR